MKKKLYISGAITGYDLKERENTFNKVEKSLSKEYEVVNPMKISKEIGYDKPYDFYIEQDLKELSKCDCIYMIDGWEKSNGANIELKRAKELNLEILYQSNNLK